MYAQTAGAVAQAMADRREKVKGLVDSVTGVEKRTGALEKAVDDMGTQVDSEVAARA